MKKYNKIQSSGKVQKFKNGAVRDLQEGKGRFDLIPVVPLFRLAHHYENGVTKGKYKENNWFAGMPQKVVYNSTIRHLMKYKGGDRSEDHLAAAAWNIFTMIDQEDRFERGTLDKIWNDLGIVSFSADEFDETKKKSKKKVKKNAKKPRKR